MLLTTVISLWYFFIPVVHSQYLKSQQSSSKNPNRNDDVMKRIINGHIVDIANYPFQVGLIQTKNERKRIICGGAIVQPTIIFTAAHCTHSTDYKPRENLSILVGANSLDDGKGREHKIEKTIKHPRFTFRGFDHDFAVILLRKPIEFDHRAQSIPISTENYRGGSRASISGWGQTETGFPSEYLRATNLTLENWNKCQVYFPRFFHPRITKNMICVRPSVQTTYYGDSGGPLTVDGKLVGLVSFGRTVVGEKKITVFTRVKNFLDFVEEVLPDVTFEH